jgi:NAD(P)-dependent dehydrogenase (short-subunit alcohol dehydrogenase family)
MTIALITGANRGLGLETARQLFSKVAGIKIVLGARDVASLEAVVAAFTKEGHQAFAVQLDVTDAASIKAAAAEVEKLHGGLDILVNNAGVIRYGPPTKVTSEDLRSVFEVNVVGLVAVTQAFLPLLLASSAPRIVNLSSILGSIAEHADPQSFIHAWRNAAYDMSKAAVNLYTVELALELKDTKVKVNAAHPGWVKTDMGGADAHLEIVDGVKTTVDLALLPESGPTGGFFHIGVHLRW